MALVALAPITVKELPKKSPFISITNDTLKTFFTGAMGAITFGGYSQYQNIETIKLNNQNQAEIMRLNNELQQQNIKLNNELQDKKIQQQMEQNKKEIQDLISKSRWF